MKSFFQNVDDKEKSYNAICLTQIKQIKGCLELNSSKRKKDTKNVNSKNNYNTFCNICITSTVCITFILIYSDGTGIPPRL